VAPTAPGDLAETSGLFMSDTEWLRYPQKTAPFAVSPAQTPLATTIQSPRSNNIIYQWLALPPLLSPEAS
jgi:hypothetical protein